jgi:FkbM family methyltransferase
VLKQLVNRVLGAAGLGIVRVRDPYREMAQALGADSVHHVVDGGAYRGTTVLRLREVFPGATIHAFEPQQESFDFLRERVGGLDRVNLHRTALSDCNGERTFFVNEAAYTSSLLPARTRAMRQVGQRVVETRTLDAMMSAAGNPIVDAIKLDLQGHELAALRGAERVLEHCRALLVEVNFRHRYVGACSFEELAGFLGQHDFGMFRLYDIAACADTGWAHADALFLKPRALA